MTMASTQRFDNKVFGGLKELGQPDVREWGRQLRRARERRRLDVATVARQCGVSGALYGAWERGEEHPIGAGLQRLHGILHAMKPLNHLLPREKDVEAATPPPLQVVPAPAPGPSGITKAEWDNVTAATAPRPEAPLPFHERLRRRLGENGTANTELAVLLGVHSSTISQWTAGTTRPTRQRYAALVDLIPELAGTLDPDKLMSGSDRGLVSGVLVRQRRAPAGPNLEQLGAAHGRALAAVAAAKRMEAMAKEAYEHAQAATQRAQEAAVDAAVALAQAAEAE